MKQFNCKTLDTFHLIMLSKKLYVKMYIIGPVWYLTLGISYDSKVNMICYVTSEIIVTMQRK